jgi:hypothetical protein
MISEGIVKVENQISERSCEIPICMRYAVDDAPHTGGTRDLI